MAASKVGPADKSLSAGEMPFTRMVWTPLLVSLLAKTILYTKGEHSASFVVKETVYGQIRGYTQEVFPRRPVDIFLGVPYASPPVGKLRFEVSKN